MGGSRVSLQPQVGLGGPDAGDAELTVRVRRSTRCIKRYIARELYNTIATAPPPTGARSLP